MTKLDNSYCDAEGNPGGRGRAFGGGLSYSTYFRISFNVTHKIQLNVRDYRRNKHFKVSKLHGVPSFKMILVRNPRSRRKHSYDFDNVHTIPARFLGVAKL